jgi:hypothetical protein
MRFRVTRVVLAAAHLDGDPTNNRLTNLRALCQRCHLLQDQSHHLAQRWITYRKRRALGDLFLGSYGAMIAILRSDRTASFPDFHRPPRISSGFTARTASVILRRPNAAKFIFDRPPLQIQRSVDAHAT